MSIERMDCIYCVGSHLYVCDCSHPHSHHTQGGSCKRESCKCERYNQTHQRLANETQKEYDKRILSKSTFRRREIV